MDRHSASGWLETLRQRAEEKRSREVEPLSLEEEIREWWDTLPDVQKFRSYNMRLLVFLFGASPARIGVALHSLGWTRTRIYQKQGPFIRLWIPPSKGD